MPVQLPPVTDNGAGVFFYESSLDR